MVAKVIRSRSRATFLRRSCPSSSISKSSSCMSFSCSEWYFPAGQEQLLETLPARLDDRGVFRWWRGVIDNPAATPIVIRLTLDGGEAGHAERDYHVNLVALLFFRDPPTARALDRHGTVDGEAQRGVFIDDKVLALDELEQVL